MKTCFATLMLEASRRADVTGMEFLEIFLSALVRILDLISLFSLTLVAFLIFSVVTYPKVKSKIVTATGVITSRNTTKVRLSFQFGLKRVNRMVLTIVDSFALIHFQPIP